MLSPFHCENDTFISLAPKKLAKRNRLLHNYLHLYQAFMNEPNATALFSPLNSTCEICQNLRFNVKRNANDTSYDLTRIWRWKFTKWTVFMSEQKPTFLWPPLY